MAVSVHLGITVENGDGLVAITDEDLGKLRDHVQKLREQVANEEAKRTARQAELVNDIQAQQLEAEAARLEAQLQAAKAANKAAVVKEGVASVTAPIQADLDNAQALAKAQEQAQAQAADKDKGE